MDPQFEELAKYIADDVEKRFSTRFDEAEKRLEGRFEEVEKRHEGRFDEAEKRLESRFDEAEKRLEGRFDEAEKRLEGVIGKQLGEAEKRLESVIGKQLGEAEKRLADGAKMNMEELRTTVTVIAEGYGATLDRIEQQIIELNGKLDTKLGDHDRVLNDHGARLTALERRRRLKADR